MKENEEGALYIQEGKTRGRQSDAFVRNGVNEWTTRVLALNASWDEELTNGFPASLGPKR